MKRTIDRLAQACSYLFGFALALTLVLMFSLGETFKHAIKRLTGICLRY